MSLPFVLCIGQAVSRPTAGYDTGLELLNQMGFIEFHCLSEILESMPEMGPGGSQEACWRLF